MTTKEIISALRRGLFSDTLLRLAADTIEKLENENNRQQAEIDKMKKEKDESFEKWKLLADKTEQHYSELYEDAIEIARLDAVKTFVKRLKEKNQHSTMDDRLCTMAMIDETLKELEGEIK